MMKQQFRAASWSVRTLHIEAAIKQARAPGDAQQLLNRKQERLNHLKTARADKLSFIRYPKNVADALKEAPKLHVSGVIIHGSLDSVHLFAVAPNLAGNSNFNCERLYISNKGRL
eukprot:2972572-Pleurochrysis_carterae.AAC.2